MNQNPYERDVQELAKVITGKRAMLMVGAGSSAIVGYPDWGSLLLKLELEFAPNEITKGDVSNVNRANNIKNQAIANERIAEYYEFLASEFRPRQSSQYVDMHMLLVQLGFCGVTTLNYDLVLEAAISGASYASGLHIMAEPIDLCNDQQLYKIHEYLQGLLPAKCHRQVLHLHGLYTNPSQMVLTANDYNNVYGVSLSGKTLDTFHRKVLWSLMSQHTMVFVGFGMNDEFFMSILNMVKRDFELHRTCHFAVVGCVSDDERSRTQIKLSEFGIRPVFYHIREVGGRYDYSGLETVIAELSAIIEAQHYSVDSNPTYPDFNLINKRMMEL